MLASSPCLAPPGRSRRLPVLPQPMPRKTIMSRYEECHQPPPAPKCLMRTAPNAITRIRTGSSPSMAADPRPDHCSTPSTRSPKAPAKNEEEAATAASRLRRLTSLHSPQRQLVNLTTRSAASSASVPCSAPDSSPISRLPMTKRLGLRSPPQRELVRLSGTVERAEKGPSSAATSPSRVARTSDVSLSIPNQDQPPNKSSPLFSRSEPASTHNVKGADKSGPQRGDPWMGPKSRTVGPEVSSGESTPKRTKNLMDSSLSKARGGVQVSPFGKSRQPIEGRARETSTPNYIDRSEFLKLCRAIRLPFSPGYYTNLTVPGSLARDLRVVVLRRIPRGPKKRTPDNYYPIVTADTYLRRSQPRR